MKRTSQTRLTAIAGLSLLLLLAFAVGAQAAAAAHFGGRSGATSPPAGTQGRGGVDGTSAIAIAVGSAQPLAGTEGRGGVAVFPSSGNSGRVAFAFSRPRGAFLPVPQAGNVPRAAVSPAPLSSTDWTVLGIILAVLAAAGAIVYAATRRRTRRHESALAAYCSSHPGDSLCGAA